MSVYLSQLSSGQLWDIHGTINEMTLAELQAVEKLINAKDDEIKNEIIEQHSLRFINCVGLERIMQIPVVDAATLNLDRESKYHESAVTPAMMGDRVTVRGLDGSNRPFFAMSVNLFDSKTGEKVTQVVEVVFKRYSLDGHGKNNTHRGDCYVTALYNQGANNQSYKSGLYSSGGMSYEQYQMVGKLLDGKKIPHQFIRRVTMQLVGHQ